MFLKFTVAVALVLSATVLESREITHQIVLKPGQPARVMTGCIPTPDDAVVYFFKAFAGQHLLVRLQPEGQLVAQALLVPPSGKQVGPGTTLDSVVGESGLFQVRILPRERSAGAFRLRLSLG